MKNFIIGGVPEHFNLPWYITLKNKEYTENNINLRWKDYPGGTGEMCRALRDKQIDMAVILTEGMVRDIINGNNSKIVQVFVKSPLLWGIHVAHHSDYNNIQDLKGTEAAISRYGSGSHLMAFVHAKNNDWNMADDLKFNVIENLDGALAGLPIGKGDYFMWEKFMTKPHVDSGVFRLIGEIPTPWPSFVIAVRNDILENDGESIQKILEIINATTLKFKQMESIDELLSKRYKLEIQDVQKWLELTEWSQENLTEDELLNIQTELLNLELIPEIKASEEILHKF